VAVTLLSQRRGNKMNDDTKEIAESVPPEFVTFRFDVQNSTDDSVVAIGLISQIMESLKLEGADKASVVAWVKSKYEI
jgi:hypothetical protein